LRKNKDRLSGKIFRFDIIKGENARRPITTGLEKVQINMSQNS
jgi:hypothetical protein